MSEHVHVYRRHWGRLPGEQWRCSIVDEFGDQPCDKIAPYQPGDPDAAPPEDVRVEPVRVMEAGNALSEYAGRWIDGGADEAIGDVLVALSESMVHAGHRAAQRGTTRWSLHPTLQACLDATERLVGP